jgi:hypothetical protein
LRIFLAFAAAAAIAVAPAHGQTSIPLGTSTQGGSSNQKSDWELEQERLNWKEGEIKLPAYPKTEDLIEFFVSSASSFRFFIDPASLAPGRDGVVRYTLVARSASGVANVSYEGMRCSTNSYKLYALGNEGRWSVRESEWRAIEPRSVQRWHLELRTRYFCPGNAQIYTAAEGLDLLRSGGKTVGEDYGRGR